MNIETILRDFTEYAEKEALPVEGISAGDDKSVVYEHHFTADRARNIYSHTKSFTSTAAGIALSEGKLNLEDRLAQRFEDKVPRDHSPMLEEIRLKDLLTMSSGFGRPYLMGADRRKGVGIPDYMVYMMSQSVVEKPGSRFLYSSADSILAGRMVEQAVGMRLSEYLYLHIFKPMDMGYPIWENDVQGHPNGGGGMFLKLTDMMKLGQLYLAGGVWKGERLLDKQWIAKATTVQIETPSVVDGREDMWSCGYGYQFWKTPYEESYRAHGAHGQITVVLPKEGWVIAVQCPENGDFERVKKALHEHVFVPLCGIADKD